MKKREGIIKRYIKHKEGIEKKARADFMNRVPEGQESLARRFYKENKKEIIKEYLEKNPEEKLEDKKWKRKMVTIAGIGIATTLAVGTYIVTNDSKTVQEISKPIEQERMMEEVIEEGIEEIKKDDYDRFFEEAREIYNTEKRDKFITNQTKQIIVEAYNKEHSENPITAERLETYDYNPYVLKRTDRLGNCTYEKHPEDKTYIKTDTEETVQKQIYEFRIDGKTVAAFYDGGSLLIDNSIEQDMWFQQMIPLMQESENLKDIYKYDNSDSYIEKQEQKYKAEIEKVLENTKNTDIAKEEIEK